MFSQNVFILKIKIKPAFPLLILMRFLFSLPVIIWAQMCRKRHKTKEVQGEPQSIVAQGNSQHLQSPGFGEVISTSPSGTGLR